MFRPLKVTFLLDGSGVYLDPEAPIHLDALLAYCAAPHHATRCPVRGEEPEDIPIPCARWEVGGHWGWRCSALAPEGPNGETIEYLRKKFRQTRAHLTTGSPVLTNATYREYNIPMTLTLAARMVGYAFGEAGKIRRELRRHIRHLGKKRAAGKGRVNDVLVEECAQDWSCVRDGRAMRFLPVGANFAGARRARLRPPYWNMHGATAVCEVGDRYDEV